MTAESSTSTQNQNNHQSRNNKTTTGVKVLNVFLIAALCYVAFTAVMFVSQRSFMYAPSDLTRTPANVGVAEMREVTLKTEDGLNLVAWYAPPKDAAKAVVLVFHGNAGNIADRAFKARLFLDQGFGVMLAEYRGFGGNPGSPTEPGLLMDGRAALAFLSAEGKSGKALVLYGESLGTGVAVVMAMEEAFFGRPVGAMVLEAPFTSAADVAKSHYPFLPARLMLKDKFKSEPLISAVRTPLFMVHGEQDQTTPVRFGKKLFAAARKPKTAMWIDGAGHNDLFEHGAGEAIIAFLNKAD